MDVLPGEKLARFIFSKSQFSAMKRDSQILGVYSSFK